MLLSRIVWQRIFALAMGNVARYRRRPRKPASKRVSPWGTGNRLWVMLLATVADAIASKDCRVQHRSWESTSRSWMPGGVAFGSLVRPGYAAGPKHYLLTGSAAGGERAQNGRTAWRARRG